jgi:hypothetical protein
VTVAAVDAQAGDVMRAAAQPRPVRMNTAPKMLTREIVLKLR